jgi:hypothetical protein
MDYLAMIGLPILPEAKYPEHAPVTFFGVQASADPDPMLKLQRDVDKGATVILTPALVRKLGEPGSDFSGVEIGPKSVASTSVRVTSDGGGVRLSTPLEVDASITATTSRVQLRAQLADAAVPLFTSRKQAQGGVFVLNVRTFSEQDFRDAEEWLLAPKPRGLSELPQQLADEIRQALLTSLGVRFEGPSGVAVYLFRQARALYNFRDEAALVRSEGKPYELKAHQCLWLDD